MTLLVGIIGLSAAGIVWEKSSTLQTVYRVWLTLLFAVAVAPLGVALDQFFVAEKLLVSRVPTIATPYATTSHILFTLSLSCGVAFCVILFLASWAKKRRPNAELSG